jgi:hypothetical protein
MYQGRPPLHFGASVVRKFCLRVSRRSGRRLFVARLGPPAISAFPPLLVEQRTSAEGPMPMPGDIWSSDAIALSTIAAHPLTAAASYGQHQSTIRRRGVCRIIFERFEPRLALAIVPGRLS